MGWEEGRGGEGGRWRLRGGEPDVGVGTQTQPPPALWLTDGRKLIPCPAAWAQAVGAARTIVLLMAGGLMPTSHGDDLPASLGDASAVLYGSDHEWVCVILDARAQLCSGQVQRNRYLHDAIPDPPRRCYAAYRRPRGISRCILDCSKLCLFLPPPARALHPGLSTCSDTDVVPSHAPVSS